MKKFLTWCIPLFVLIIVAGVTLIVIYNSNTSKTIYATKFEYKHESALNLYINDEITLNKTEFKIEPSNCTENIFFTTNDSNILEIDNKNNKIIAKSEGNCTLFAHIKSSIKEILTTEITVSVNKNNQNVETINHNFNLSEGSRLVYFNAGSTKDENTITITEGNDIISYEDVEYNRLTVIFHNTGFATIEIECNTKRVIINITVV